MRAALLTVLAFTVGCGKSSATFTAEQRNSGATARGKVLRTGAELRAAAEGERVAIEGKVGAGGHGATEITDIANKKTSPATTPLFSVTLQDGTIVTCAFGDAPRADYEAWLKRNPPGTLVLVEGARLGWSGTDFTLAAERVLPNGFK